jgi:hypothetical protein
MTLRRRLSVLAAIAAVATLALVLGRSYSADLVQTVVERSLVQKTRGAGVSAGAVQASFHAALYRRPGRAERVEFLLETARSLEKVQRLDHEEFERLMGDPTAGR